MHRYCLLLAVSLMCGTAQAYPGVKTAARECVEAIVKRYGDDAARQIAEFGGEKAVRETLEKAAREGGEELAEKLVRYGDNYGVSAFKALSRNPRRLVQAVDALPTSLVKPALRAIERNPDELAHLVVAFGPDALEVAARQPGVGGLALGKLGKDIVPVAEKLSEGDFMRLTRYFDDLAELPQQASKRTLQTITEHTAKALDYLETHPKVLKTAAAGGLALVYKDGIIETAQAVVGIETTTTEGPHGRTTIIRGGLVRVLKTPLSAGIIILSVGLIIVWLTRTILQERSRARSRENRDRVEPSGTEQLGAADSHRSETEKSRET